MTWCSLYAGSPSHTPSPSPSPAIVGAANAGSNPAKSSAIPAMRPFSGVAFAITALAAIAALTL
jgi:hypothetical protein